MLRAGFRCRVKVAGNSNVGALEFAKNFSGVSIYFGMIEGIEICSDFLKPISAFFRRRQGMTALAGQSG